MDLSNGGISVFSPPEKSANLFSCPAGDILSTYPRVRGQGKHGTKEVPCGFVRPYCCCFRPRCCFSAQRSGCRRRAGPRRNTAAPSAIPCGPCFRTIRRRPCRPGCSRAGPKPGAAAARRFLLSCCRRFPFPSPGQKPFPPETAFRSMPSMPGSLQPGICGSGPDPHSNELPFSIPMTEAVPIRKPLPRSRVHTVS